MMLKTITLARMGTRGSVLARWQTRHIAQLLQAAYPHLAVAIEVIETAGDQLLDLPLPQIGGKGVFTAELEAALTSGAIDLAVHSLKDLPTQEPSHLVIGAIPTRATPADVLVSPQAYTLDTLPPGASVGTSSLRRKAQLLSGRPDLHISEIRGNVNTRVRKAMDASGAYDAVVLAQAGLERLAYREQVGQALPFAQMLPAPGQGALAVQCRDEVSWLNLLAPLNHRQTQLAVAAERGFLQGLGGGCSMPIAAYAHIEQQQLHLTGRVCAPAGSRQITLQSTIMLPLDQESAQALIFAREAGLDMARSALTQGALALLEVH
ncbi:MAG TPA: hydroxymethylbilane synthase [Ktedonobacteraceae bacterium]|jgi:hydroxymethylbilane synthase